MNGLTEKLADKLVFFLISLAVYLPVNTTTSAAVPVLVAVGASALASYLDRPLPQAGVALAFTGLCLAVPDLSYFLPLIALDLYASPWPWLAASAAVPLLTHAPALGLPGLASVAVSAPPAAVPASVSATVLSPAVTLTLLVLLAGYVHRRSRGLAELRRHAHGLRDAAQESSLREARQREALLEKQDYEVRLATLRERNRIAREIHDHVGHQLASAILQLGALMAVSRDAAVRPPLEQLKTTLVESMESIRSSVHDLHDQSVDLEAEVHRMAAGFRFCPLKLDYDVAVQPAVPVRSALLAIIQEGLANIMRHSGASEAQLTLREHPGFYQMILRDNGGAGRDPGDSRDTGAATGLGLPMSRPGAGMGLNNIEERVQSLGGNVHFQKDRGFTIFISIPRESRTAAQEEP